jgi:ataxia telangiectasia mutated family protein
VGRSASASKLELCAYTLRLAVEVSVSKLRAKTVKALIDHLTGAIFLSDGSYCEPLSVDYSKALHTLLSHPAHVEHLSKADWSSLSDFCLAGIENHQDLDPVKSFTGSNGRTTVVASRQSGLDGSSKSNNSSFIGRDKAHGHGKKVLEQLLLVLSTLVSASNAPLSENAQSILIGLTRVLRSQSMKDEARQASLSTVNRILARATVSCISATKDAMDDLLLIINVTWSTKQMSLRDELIIMWIHCRGFVQSILQEDSNFSCKDRLENLLDTLKIEYGSRGEKDRLQLDNVHLQVKTTSLNSAYPLQIKHMVLSRGNTRKEEHWMVPSMISDIISLLGSSKASSINEEDREGESEQPKRRKLNNHLRDLQRDLRQPSISSRISGLQVLAFLLSRNDIEPIEIQQSIESLIPYVSDTDPKISSWAMIALAR